MALLPDALCVTLRCLLPLSRGRVSAHFGSGRQSDDLTVSSGAHSARLRSNTVTSVGLACFLGLLGTSSAYAAANTADEVLSAHKKALGGDANLAKQSFSILQGTATHYGSPRTFTWSMLSPQSLREDAVAAGLSESVALVGSDGWHRALNGTTSRLHGHALEQAQLMSLVLTFAYARGEELELEYGKPSTSADGKLITLPVSGRKMPRIELSIDASSWLLRSAKTVGTEDSCTVSLDDYRKVGVLKFPHKVSRSCTGASGAITDDTRYEVQKVDLKTPVEEGLFERTTDSDRKFVFPAGQTSVQPEFQYDPAVRLPLVKASLQGGESHFFLLDTTARYSVLDQKVIDTLKLSAVDRFYDPASSSVRPLYALEKLTLAGAELAKTVVIGEEARTFTPTLTGGGTPPAIAGVLGLELLEHLAIEMDYAGRRLTLHSPADYTDRGTAESLRLDDFGRVNVLLNGQSLLSVRLNTRHRGTVHVPPEVLEREKLLPEASRRMTGELAGVTDLGDGEVGTFASVQLGQLSLTGVLAAFRTGKNLPGEEASLGNQVLERLKVTFDLTRQQILVEQGQEWGKGWRYDRSGLTFKPGVPLIVATVRPEQAPFVVGDQINAVWVNGAWVKDAKIIREQFFEPAGTRLKFKLKKPGKEANKEIEKELELKDWL